MRLSLSDVVRDVRSGRLKVSVLAKQALETRTRVEPTSHAWVRTPGHYHSSSIWQEAQKMDSEARNALFRGPLHGIPIGVKDLIDVEGYPTTAGSTFYTRFATKDAPFVKKFRDSGALIVGKTTTSPYACSFKPVKTVNPLNPLFTPGGSSCGSVVAVATRTCFAALGTQTAGSILQPAAYCGVTGFKPSAGLFSNEGIFPACPDLDQV